MLSAHFASRDSLMKIGLWFALIAILLAAGSAHADSLTLTPRVDPRVELLSIVSRLAGYQEYSNCVIPRYVADIDSAFAPYKNHPAIEYARGLRTHRQVAYDAVMSLAIHLSPPPELKPLVPFTDSIPDPRFNADNAENFTNLLRDFYRDAHFAAFFEAHRDLYSISQTRFEAVTARMDFNWFKAYYGTMPVGTFHVIIGLNNGHGNYGPKLTLPDGREEPYAIIGCGQTDSLGLPDFTDEWLSLLVHEFTHSFVNPVVDKHYASFESAAEKVFAPVADQLRESAYGSASTMVCESLVRAGVILFMRDHGTDSAATRWSTIYQQLIGFVWMDALCDTLSAYHRQRDHYPTFDSYMPVIAAFYTALSADTAGMMHRFEGRLGHVTAIEPFDNKSQTVDPTCTRITLHFDRPMHGDTLRDGDGGKDHNPAVGRPAYLDGGKTLVIPVSLKPDWDYSFALSGQVFKTAEDYPLRRYVVEFKTSPASGSSAH